MNHSRREFCQLTAGALFGSQLAFAQSGGTISAREVVARIKKNVGIPWHTPTADEFKIGDPDAPVTGITTTFMSTLDVLQRSHAVGNNFVISHEPTFWSANDEVSVLRDDPLYRVKVDFIQKNRMVVWRFHDHWHGHRPDDGIFVGWNRFMGWEAYQVNGPKPMARIYQIPQSTLRSVAREMQAKLSLKSIRLVGDPQMPVQRLGHAGHYIAQCMEMLPSVDALIVFECREWEAAEYVRDAIASGQKKALIQLPHEGGEEAGMDEAARWLQAFVPEVPVKFIAAGDPFWMPS